MLARAGFGDDALLAHAHGHQDLAEAVVDLVGAGVVELVALEVNARAAEMGGQPLGEVQRAGPAGVMRVEVIELRGEGRVGAAGVISLLDLEDERHQRLGDVTAAEQAEVAVLVGAGSIGVARFRQGFARP